MYLLDGGCFMALSDSLVAADLRSVEEFTRMDLLARSGLLTDANLIDVCVIERTRAGLWYVYAMIESSGCEIDDNRVAGLVCISEGEFEPARVSTDFINALPWQEVPRDETKWHTNQVQVRCGTVGLLCMESIRRCARTYGLAAEDHEAFSAFIRGWANAMCQATTTTSKICLSNMPNGPIGAVSSVGICDSGRYSCHVLKDELTGEVSGFKMLFPSEE
ncbi:uncharacterized protein BcabD6B2_37120 [Babesia caballi]|uniref:Uncharacterized protein n=1 Tax=Babesia caballi TaxID=5871 RepID=A0AAV4LWT8_BABCB|nr:hypothetical protein, conserved [Babesia caballi]